jgi:hypothetical protein
MREGVIVSMAFLFVGAGLIFLASSVMPSVLYLPLIANVLGIICVLFAPFILITTFIVTVLPGSKEKLNDCDH